MNLNLKFWYEYKTGIIKRNLTKEEEQEIRANDFAMHLLLPTESFKRVLKKLKLDGYNNEQIVIKLSENFRVPPIVVLVKLNEFENKPKIIQNKIINFEEAKKRIKRKNQNIINNKK